MLSMTTQYERPALSTKLPCRSYRAPQNLLRRQQSLKQRLSRSKLLCRAAKGSLQVTIQSPAGEELRVDKDFFSIGSAGGSDLLLQGKQVAEEHACIEVKKGRLYCTALVGDHENFMDETFTWLNGSELRPGCSYLLTPGAKLAFGDEDQQYTLQFDEKSGSDPLGDMLIKGMLSQASPEVQKRMTEDM